MRLRRRAAPRRGPLSASASSSTPAFSASISRLPRKSVCSTFSTKVNMSPPSWQPKQYHACLSWLTLNEGVFSE